MATDRLPRLSIGLPVYNGERYIRYALDSLINQTYRDFELIISDNASTDSTVMICQEYAARDPRIRFVRNTENVGAAKNFNQAFWRSRGEYFKWAAADDVISPSFLEECVAVLDQNPDVVLAYTKADRIDSSGEINGAYDFPMRVDAAEPHVRFSDLILVNHFCTAVFGVFRRHVLAKTLLIDPYVGSDRVLLAEIGLRGRMYEVNKYLFHRRDHPQASGRQFKMYNRLAWFDPNRRNHINLVYTKMGTAYLHVIDRVPLPWTEKVASYRAVMSWFIRRRRALVEDLKAGVIHVFPFSRSIVGYAKRIHNSRIKSGGGI